MHARVQRQEHMRTVLAPAGVAHQKNFHMAVTSSPAATSAALSPDEIEVAE